MFQLDLFFIIRKSLKGGNNVFMEAMCALIILLFSHFRYFCRRAITVRVVHVGSLVNHLIFNEMCSRVAVVMDYF